MASNNIIFHQTTHKNGECEFRVKFGRNKSFVYRRHDQFYYLDLYDNKVGKTRFNGMCLGLDELDFLISLRSNLDSLQSCFQPMVSIFNCNLENQVRVHHHVISFPSTHFIFLQLSTSAI